MNTRHRWVVAQTLVTVLLLVLLARRLDLAAMTALFAGVPWWFYLLSLAVVLLGQVAYAWRWTKLLRAGGVAVPFTRILCHYFVAIFVNNFLPSTVGGDVAKVYYLGQRHGYRPIAASVALDRILGVGLLAALAAGALAASPVGAARLTAAQIVCSGIAVAALGALVLTGVGTGGLPARVRWLGTRAVDVAARLQRLRLEMSVPLSRPAVYVHAAVVVVGYAVAVTLVYMRFVALDRSTPPPFLAMFAVVTATTVLSSVPISVNGLGLREQLHASLLAPLGIAPEVAVAISLLLYAHLLIASAIGLVFWLRAPVVADDAVSAS